jgi:hypothetical protein
MADVLAMEAQQLGCPLPTQLARKVGAALPSGPLLAVAPS